MIYERWRSVRRYCSDTEPESFICEKRCSSVEVYTQEWKGEKRGEQKNFVRDRHVLETMVQTWSPRTQLDCVADGANVDQVVCTLSNKCVSLLYLTPKNILGKKNHSDPRWEQQKMQKNKSKSKSKIDFYAWNLQDRRKDRSLHWEDPGGCQWWLCCHL